ncbi:MAG TPA: aminotransferase class III-fold pyridoxal phosphate-dependent enzyme [Gemmatimonadales bacterium]|nr:aminotransferase class III-fold pyridoxal phosphate-dependent enzyme [Gemmatimonadales bacterium]
MTDWHVPGFTSTGSKRPEALFGPPGDGPEPSSSPSPPERMVRSAGCRVWDPAGREYLDYTMALGAVGLGYGHPAVTRAASAAVEAGVVGPLPPVIEEELAAALCGAIPWIEAVRFLKTGAEAVAAAVRLGRVITGRDRVLGCGYHGWLDWCQGGATPGIPAATRALYAELPFNDVERTRAAIRDAGDTLAVVVVEPVVVAEPSRAWLETLRAETTRVGAILVFDEIKTAFRLAIGGAAERYGIRPDLVVLGKALANGFPLAAVGGRADVMAAATRTWISSTLATEAVALAAARATLEVMIAERVCDHLHAVGTRLLHGLHHLHHLHPAVVRGVGGLAEMCFLHYASDALSHAAARACAARGVLFKRTAYNFVSLAHDDAVVDRTISVLDDVCGSLGR